MSVRRAPSGLGKEQYRQRTWAFQTIPKVVLCF
jgi:hypothetical protein